MAGTLSIAQWLLTALMLLGLPLAGAALNGEDIFSYLHFPPLTRNVPHAAFSWPIFFLFAALDAALAGWLVRLLISGRGKAAAGCCPPKGAWPPWGWPGLVLMAAGWLLAWTRFEWFAPFQNYTFYLPWAGYILTANALCLLRSGRSLLTDDFIRF